MDRKKTLWLQDIWNFGTRKGQMMQVELSIQGRYEGHFAKHHVRIPHITWASSIYRKQICMSTIFKHRILGERWNEWRRSYGNTQNFDLFLKNVKCKWGFWNQQGKWTGTRLHICEQALTNLWLGVGRLRNQKLEWSWMKGLEYIPLVMVGNTKKRKVKSHYS
jgi:hypothetical protein